MWVNVKYLRMRRELNRRMSLRLSTMVVTESCFSIQAATNNSISRVSMASNTPIDDDANPEGDFPVNNTTNLSGIKRSAGYLDDEDDDIFGSKKANLKVEETPPSVVTGMISSLRESLANCEETLATCQTELDTARSEIQKWHFAFQNESLALSGTSPEPKLVVSYLRTLKSSEESLREQLEKAKKKEAAFIVTFAKREQEIAELKTSFRDARAQLKPPSMQARRLLLDPAIHEEFTRLKNMVEEKEKKIKELLDNVAAVNFTPQSKMGKMLMAKCRTLQAENDDIGNQAEEGKMHELSMKLAVQRSQNAELKNQFEGLVKHIKGLTKSVEKSNEMVLISKEKLEEKEAEIRRLKQELHQKQTTTMEEVNDEFVSDKKNVIDDEPITSNDAKTEND